MAILTSVVPALYGLNTVVQQQSSGNTDHPRRPTPCPAILTKSKKSNSRLGPRQPHFSVVALALFTSKSTHSGYEYLGTQA